MGFYSWIAQRLDRKCLPFSVLVFSGGSWELFRLDGNEGGGVPAFAGSPLTSRALQLRRLLLRLSRLLCSTNIDWRRVAPGGERPALVNVIASCTIVLIYLCPRGRKCATRYSHVLKVTFRRFFIFKNRPAKCKLFGDSRGMNVFLRVRVGRLRNSLVSACFDWFCISPGWTSNSSQHLRDCNANGVWKTVFI